MAVECIRGWRDMVQVGFICEGYTEQILLQSDFFKDFLHSINIDPLPIINAEGSANLLPHNIVSYITRLEHLGAQRIVILTDLDDDKCITLTKDRVSARPIDIVVIAVKKIESWFLACTPALRQLLGDPGYNYDQPEEVIDPFETINGLLVKYTNRGIGKKTAGKIKLATRMIACGFDFIKASEHPNCPSVRYFVTQLNSLSS